MIKYYITNEIASFPEEKFDVGKTIYFEMPSFCSGDYKAKIYKDAIGLYIDKENNWFEGCRDFQILN